MRARIDISEIEAETKIRAKYLRALENEEWDLLPGPTYVKSFLRTYADALGLDGKLLIEEYKLRHERLSDVELQPIAPPGQRERRRRAAGAPSRAAGWWRVVVLGPARGAVGDRQPQQRRQRRAGQHAAARDEPADDAPPRPARRRRQEEAKKKAKAKPKLARLTIVATGQVYVCLKAAGKRTPVPGIVLTGGARQGPYKSSRFRLQLGTSEARLIVNGKSRSVPSGGQRHRLRDHAHARCAACPPRSGRAARPRERARRHRRHGHRGPHGPRDRPQRAVAVRAPARARRRPRLHAGRRRPPRGHGRRRCASWPRAASTSIVTSGGLGPTADDLTAEVVGAFAGRDDGPRRAAGGAHRRDPAPAAVALARPRPRGDPRLQPQAGGRAGGRDDPRAGRHRARARGARSTAARRSSCCPGRRASCTRCGRPRWRPRPSARPSPGAVELRQEMLRLFGIPESEIAETLRLAEDAHGLEGLEITTCLRRGEVEVVTRFSPAAAARLRALRGDRPRAPRRHAVLRRRAHGRPAGGRPAARARAHDRHGRVVHRRAAGRRG